MRADTKHFRWKRYADGMTCVVLLFVVAAAATPACAVLPRHHQSKSVLQAIARLERTWLAAQLDANVNVMASMMADDYLGISPNGTLESKTETLDAFKSGAVHFTAMTTSERKIRIYGSTAVVISRADVTGTHNGHLVSGRYRYTRVYHYDGTNWKIVSFEASKMRKGPNRFSGKFTSKL